MPRCYDCHSEDVTVKIMRPDLDVQWYCAEHWDAREKRRERDLQRFHDARAAR